MRVYCPYFCLSVSSYDNLLVRGQDKLLSIRQAIGNFPVNKCGHGFPAFRVIVHVEFCSKNANITFIGFYDKRSIRVVYLEICFSGYSYFPDRVDEVDGIF